MTTILTLTTLEEASRRAFQWKQSEIYSDGSGGKRWVSSNDGCVLYAVAEYEYFEGERTASYFSVYVVWQRSQGLGRENPMFKTLEEAQQAAFEHYEEFYGV